VRIFPVPATASADRAPSPRRRRAGDTRSAALTATITAPPAASGRPASASGKTAAPASEAG
jgi:hypothetical protein